MIILMTTFLLSSATAVDIGGGAGGGNRVPETKETSVHNKGMVDKIMTFFRGPASKPNCKWANSEKNEVICNQHLFKKASPEILPASGRAN